MGRLATKHTAAGIGCAVLFALAAGAGCGPADEDVRARNLLTGEVQSFGSEADVPSDWVICEAPDCPVPETVPCQDLSETVCTLNPSCRLKTVWCAGTASGSPGGDEPEEPTVVEEQCEYECIPEHPLLCEELTEEADCATRPDCEWGQFYCPAMACAPDQPGCEVPCPYSCRTKTPPICQQLTDEQSCTARSDCEWDPIVCTQECIDDGEGGCLPCPDDGTCRPKTPVPPPCPAIAPPPPDYCPDGKIVYESDENGCVTSYRCEKPSSCWDLNTAYINAVKKAKACSPYILTATPQCSKAVDTALFCPLCRTFINPANAAALNEMDSIKQKWLALGCDKLEVACPAISCVAPTSGTCLPSSADASGGSCVDDVPAP